MAKNSKPDWEKKLQNSWPMLFGLGFVLLAMAYGFASWAIDSGNLLHYAATIILIIWAAKEFKSGIKLILHKH